MISQAVLTCLNNHQAKYPMLEDKLNHITKFYKEKYSILFTLL